MPSIPRSILELEHRGLRKIISGGQCGADRGGLEAAKKWGLETGGQAPQGWRTHYGPAPELAEFGLTEHFRAEYPYRTEQNVAKSDGTLIIASDAGSPGVELTRRICHRLKKPFFFVGPRYSPSEIDSIVRWIEQYAIEILNIAGNRDKVKGQNFHFDLTICILNQVFTQLRTRGKLNLATE